MHNKLNKKEINLIFPTATHFNYRLGTDACYVFFGQYVLQKSGETTSTGGWCNQAVDTAHMTDYELVAELRHLLRNKTVVSFGEGPGTVKCHIKHPKESTRGVLFGGVFN